MDLISFLTNQKPMATFWRVIFYQPILNLLVGIYHVVGDMGIAIVLLTLLFKLVLYPLSRQALKSQRALQLLQPKVEELKVKYKDQKDVMSRELMALYQREKVSPFSSCLPLLVQLPLLIALYRVFMSGLNSGSLDLLYSFIPNPGHLSSITLGIWDLTKHSIVLAVLAGAAQYWQSKMLVRTPPAVKTPGAKDEGMMASMNKQMLYMMPVITIIFGSRLPSGLVLYWLVNILFTVGQQYLAFRSHAKATAPAV